MSEKRIMAEFKVGQTLVCVTDYPSNIKNGILYSSWYKKGEKRKIKEINQETGLILFDGEPCYWYLVGFWEVYEEDAKTLKAIKEKILQDIEDCGRMRAINIDYHNARQAEQERIKEIIHKRFSEVTDF